MGITHVWLRGTLPFTHLTFQVRFLYVLTFYVDETLSQNKDTVDAVASEPLALDDAVIIIAKIHLNKY